MSDHTAPIDSRASELIAVYESTAKKNGLTVPMLRVLETVCLCPGCTQKAVGDAMRTSKQRVNLLVRELVQRQLLTQRRNENDGRSKLLALTQKGEAITAELRRAAEHGDGASASRGTHTHVLEDGTVVTHSHGDAHGHVHSHQHTKAVLDRLARSIGHLEKVRQMVEAGADCSEVLIQLSAVKASVNSTGKLILKDHIEHCLVDAVEHGDHQTVEELNRAIDQFIK